jgi:hypothetical protein
MPFERMTSLILTSQESEGPMPMVITVWGVTAVVAGILGALLATAKRRSADAWATASFLFPPSLLALVLLPRATDQMVADRRMRKALSRFSTD